MKRAYAFFALLAIVLMSFVSVAVANYGPDPPDCDQVSIEIMDIEETPVVAPAEVLLRFDEGDRFLGPGDISQYTFVMPKLRTPRFYYNINYLQPLLRTHTLHYAQIGYGLWN